jgi:hypothetical protein
MIITKKDCEIQSLKLELRVEQSHVEYQEKWNVLFTEYFGKKAELSRSTFANSTVIVTPEYNQQMIRLSSILNKACEAIVLNYFKDERIRKQYQLDQELERLLEKANKKSYSQGFYRPDFLYDVNNQAKICEIGARYSLNGWMISYYIALINDDLYSNDTELISGNPDLKNLIKDLYKELAPCGKVALVHDNEKGTEIFLMQKELAKRGLELLSVKPQDLKLSNDSICVDGQPVLQFILEMDREELKKIRPEVMDKLIEQNSYFNDIRSLILIHDKRVLSVMYDVEIMSDYLTEVEYSFLQDYLIPSFVITNPKECDDYIYTDQNLILKLNSGGRGIGAYIKNECSIEEWEKIIRLHWNEYLIQHFVDQKEFPDIENNRQIHLVGSLLCKNNLTYGSGLFRGSDESVVNVHQGRALIYPFLLNKKA